MSIFEVEEKEKNVIEPDGCACLCGLAVGHGHGGAVTP